MLNRKEDGTTKKRIQFKKIICFYLCAFLMLLLGCKTSPPTTIMYDWHLTYLSAPTAWKTTKGENITVAIIDSGIDYDLLGENFAARIKATYNAYDDNNDLTDYTYHGTGMLCLVGANGENDCYGIAPECNFIVVKALNAAGGTNSEVLTKAIEFSIEHGADIINLSLGGGAYNEEVSTVIQKAYDKNIVVVSAVGDQREETALFPASLQETLSVGAIDENGEMYAESNYGTGVDVFVPGVNICVPKYAFGKKIVKKGRSGSSVATAVFSGIVALYLSTHDDYKVENVYEFFRNSYDNNLEKIIL